LTALCALLFVCCTPTASAFAARSSSTAGGSAAAFSHTVARLTIGNPLEEFSTRFYLQAEADGNLIEFNHVAEESFNALDTRDDPAEGTQFALNSDKTSTQVDTTVVDGSTPIDDVVHQDDDGGVTITDMGTLDITATSETTTHLIQFMNVTYPNKTALPGMKFDLYTQKAYDAAERDVPFKQSLIADGDGILKTPDGESTFELSADSYCLVQSEGFDGYPPLGQPVRFTITSSGALEVLQADQEVHDFAYGSTTADGKLLLQIPHFKPATVEMLFQVQGDYADLTKEFEFQLAIPEGMSEIEASIDDTPVTLSAESNTVALRHGQSLKLMNVPDSESYELTQTDASVAQSPYVNGGCYNPQLQVVTENAVKATLKQDDARVLTLSELEGTGADPAKITITNTLQNDKVPVTGIDNDDSPWLAVVFASATALAVLFALWLLRKRRHKAFLC
jgi:hypothetical protein